jgi:peptidyl-prolyl cis-trans isomerase C
MTNREIIRRLTTIALLCLSLGACSGEEPVVRIGDREVSKAEFEAYLKYKRVASADEKKLQRTLDDYADRAALAAAIEREKLVDHEDLKVELDEVKKELLISRYFEKLLDEKVGDDAVRNHYRSNEKQYEEKKAHVAHVLVRTSPTMNETELKVRHTRIQEAHGKLAAGTEFAKVAAEYSEDRISNVKGGDIGWIKQGGIDPKFSEVAFGLKPGEVSQPFQSQFGYHVVKLLDGPTVIRKPFEGVAGDIRYQLRQQVKDAELKRLAGQIKVEKNAAVLKTVKAPGSPRLEKHAQN